MDSDAGRPVPGLPSAEYAWPMRSDELLRAAGYDPEAIRWRMATGSPWRVRPGHMIAVLLAAAICPALALVALAAIARAVTMFL